MSDNHPGELVEWEYVRIIGKQKCTICENTDIWLVKATWEETLKGEPGSVSSFAVECAGPHACYMRGPLAKFEESALMAWTKLNYY